MTTRKMTERERTSYHEAGHSVIGEELGHKAVKISLTHGGSGGLCHSEGHHLPLRDELIMLLSGRMAVALAEEGNSSAPRWWQVDLRYVIDHECGHTAETPGKGSGRTFEDWVTVVAEGRRGTRAEARLWLDEELKAAARGAVGILQKHAAVVADLASRLHAEGELDLRGWHLPGKPMRSATAAAPISLEELRRKSRQA